VHFPVPWSRAPETSFLVTFDTMKSALEPTGFKVVAWDDRTQAAVDWFVEQAEGPRRRPGRRACITTAAWPACRHGDRFSRPVGKPRPQSPGRARRDPPGRAGPAVIDHQERKESIA